MSLAELFIIQLADCEQGIPCPDLPKNVRPRIFAQTRADRLMKKVIDKVVRVSVRKF